MRDRVIKVRIDEDGKRELEKAARSMDLTVSSFVRFLVKQWLRNNISNNHNIKE